MRYRAAAPKIAVPGVLVLVDAALRHALIQHRGLLFALAAADDLAAPRRLQFPHQLLLDALVEKGRVVLPLFQ